jgi:hypothetical protein
MRRRKVMPSLDVLNEWFYEEPSGVLRWRKDYLSDRGDSRVVGKAGEVAGHARKSGVQISLHGHTYFRSRLIYKMHEGKEPTGVVQHRNQSPLDDRFENLKDVAVSPNVRDARARSGDYFVVVERTGFDGRTVKTVSLAWRCDPEEDAEAIAVELNRRAGDYLKELNQQRAGRTTQGHEERLQRLQQLLRRAGAKAVSGADREVT